MSLETRAKVISMRSRNYSVSKIKNHLKEGVMISKVSFFALFKKYDATKSIEYMKKEPRPQILVQLHYRFLYNIMTENNDFTSRQLHSALVSEYRELCGISVSTVKRVRNRLGWISKKNRYCALISEGNQEKRLDYCKSLITTNDLEFPDVIWTDECSVQLESHRKIVYHRRGEPSKLCGRPKHPYKVHVWGGISKHGGMKIVIFTGIIADELAHSRPKKVHCSIVTDAIWMPIVSVDVKRSFSQCTKGLDY